MPWVVYVIQPDALKIKPVFGVFVKENTRAALGCDKPCIQQNCDHIFLQSIRDSKT